MKKGLKIILIIFVAIAILLTIFFLIRIFGFAPYDKYMFNKAIETGEVKYCHEILDYAVAPGLGTTCVNLLAQLNDDSSTCEELRIINSIYIDDCYAIYAYYKGDESLCIEPQCSKTLFNYCEENRCETINDYR